ncbi:MAG: aminotransferase class IV [Acidobacteriota bacterium]|nr:aminotransferase class IV [Acidobacteriota bacterium]
MLAQPVRQALDFGERPDPARGIFETLLVADGAAPLLAAQLERLRASALELYGIDLEPELAGLARTVPDGSGRLRISFVPGEGTASRPGPHGDDPRYAEIAPFVLAGGLGAHKWADRGLLEGLLVAAGPGALPLLLDADGSVLESASANVLIEERGRLVSPPSDGRFRAGFGRARVRYSEEPVDLDRLLAADAILLTSALRTVRVPRGAR